MIYLIKKEQKKKFKRVSYAVAMGEVRRYVYTAYENEFGTPKLHRVREVKWKKFDKMVKGKKAVGADLRDQILERVKSRLSGVRIYKAVNHKPMDVELPVGTPVMCVSEIEKGMFEKGIEYLFCGYKSEDRNQMMVEDGEGVIVEVSRESFIRKGH
jgi:hypothetical protein